MESLPSEVTAWFLAQPMGWAVVIFAGLYLYERYGRVKDRKDFDTALSKANADHIKTLKIVTPLALKFTDTMNVVMPLVMAQLNRRGE